MRGRNCDDSSELGRVLSDYIAKLTSWSSCVEPGFEHQDWLGATWNWGTSYPGGPRGLVRPFTWLGVRPVLRKQEAGRF